MFYVYIVTNQRNGTIYIGMTDDLGRRIYEQKEKVLPRFTGRHGCNRLEMSGLDMAKQKPPPVTPAAA